MNSGLCVRSLPGVEERGRGGMEGWREKEKDEQREGREAEGGEGQREGIQCSSWNSAATQAHLATSIGFFSGANEVGMV